MDNQPIRLDLRNQEEWARHCQGWWFHHLGRGFYSEGAGHLLLKISKGHLPEQAHPRYYDPKIMSTLATYLSWKMEEALVFPSPESSHQYIQIFLKSWFNLIKSKKLNPPAPPEKPDAACQKSLDYWAAACNLPEELSQKPSADALLIACFNGHLDVVDHLLKAGIKPSTAAFEQAIQSRQLAIVLRLLATVPKGFKELPIHLACERGCVSIVLALIKHDPRLLRKEMKNKTPLEIACQQGHLDLVKTLLAQDPKQPIDLALLDAQRQEKSELVEILKAHQLKMDPAKALFDAIENDQVELVRQLLADNPALASETRNNGFATTLHAACYHGNPVVFDLLLQAGANPRLTNRQGRTPIELAEIKEKHDAVKAIQDFLARPKPQPMPAAFVVAAPVPVMDNVENVPASVPVPSEPLVLEPEVPPQAQVLKPHPWSPDEDLGKSDSESDTDSVEADPPPVAESMVEAPPQTHEGSPASSPRPKLPSEAGTRFLNYLKQRSESHFSPAIRPQSKLKKILLDYALTQLRHEEYAHLSPSELLRTPISKENLYLTKDQSNRLLLEESRFYPDQRYSSGPLTLELILSIQRYRPPSRAIPTRPTKSWFDAQSKTQPEFIRSNAVNFLNATITRLKKPSILYKNQEKIAELEALCKALLDTKSDNLPQTLDDLCQFKAPNHDRNLLEVLMMHRNPHTHPEKPTRSYTEFCKLFSLRELLGDLRLQFIAQNLTKPPFGS